MAASEGELLEAQSRLILAADFEADFGSLRHLAQDFGDRVRAVKLGQAFLLETKAWPIHEHLLDLGTETSLDAKYKEDADQMSYVVAKAFKRGFRHVSVAPSAGVDSLVSAAMATPTDRMLFIAMPTGNGALAELALANVRDANFELDDEHRLWEVMCNVNDIERVKSIGDFTVIATGIRLEGDSPDDQPAVATPAEALQLGADFLAVGRAITNKRDRTEAFNNVVENMATAL